VVKLLTVVYGGAYGYRDALLALMISVIMP
jgi:hypothetical protein